MGQKIATEEDYWTCTQGIMPARMQSIQLTVKQKDGKRYLLKTDTATASVGDFVCKWMMLLMAAIAAIVAVAIVATGGAALAVIVAAGAIAGAAGAAVGTIAGGLVCGQKAALIRTWSEEKHNLVIAGQKTLTSASMMKCPVFGAEIKRAPNIKNWWQALLVGMGNFGTTVVEGALGGAMIGTVGALAAGAATLAVPTLGTVWANVAGSFTGIGLAVRGIFGANEASNEWASGQVNTMGEAAQSFGSGAVPEAGSLKRIATGQAQPSDALLLLYFLHLKTPVKEPTAPKEEEGQPKQEETNGPKPANEPEPIKEGEDGKAYEKGESSKVKEFKVGDEIAGKPIVNVIEGTNGKVAVIGRRMAGHVEDVGANLKANGEQVELFNEQSQSNKKFNIDGETYTWKEISDDFGDKSKYIRNEKGWIVDSDLDNTLMYKANKQWAEKLVNDKYTVIDMGYPPDVQSKSVFYDMELNTIFGK